MKVLNTNPLVMDFDDIIITVKHSNRPASELFNSIELAMQEINDNGVFESSPDIYVPECCRGQLQNPGTAYGIGDGTDDSYGMWDGPNPSLDEILNRTGRSNDSKIFELPSGRPLYSWSEEGCCWNKIL